MNYIKEDELLKPLFRKIPMEPAPGNINEKIMDRIMADPEIQPERKPYFQLWWLGLGLLSLISMYFTGVFNFLRSLFAPYLIEIYSMFTQYTGELTDLLPSNVVILPSSYVLPFILLGGLLIILLDTVFGRNYSGVTYR